MKLRHSSRKVLRTTLLATTTLSLLATGPARAVTWVGGSGDTLWNNPANWSDGTLPDNQAVLFGETGKTDKSTPGSIVSANTTIQSLTYHNTGSTASSWQVTQINSGATLTINGNDSVIYQIGYSLYDENVYKETNVAFTGEGTLQVGTGNTADVIIGNAAPGKSTTMGAMLDLSGLAQTHFNLGTGSVKVAADDRSNATFILSNTTSIIAAHIYVGGQAGKNSKGVLKFDADNPAPKSILIRGEDNGAMDSFEIGVYTGSSTSGSQLGEVDFSGATVDAVVNTFIMARGLNSNATGHSEGTFTMDAGTFVIQTGTIGSARNTSSALQNPHTGTLNIKGGTFEAGSLALAVKDNGNSRSTGIINISGSGTMVVTNGIQMGHRNSGTSEETLTATINLTGGSLTVGGNIAEGSGGSAIASTVNLDGGHLNLGGNAISVDTFLVQSGTLSNLGQYNSGANLTKTSSGTLHVAGLNNYSGNTDVTAGRLVLSGTLANSHVTVSNDSVLQGDGGSIANVLTIEAGASLAFDLGSTAPEAMLTVGSLTLAEGANLSLGLTATPTSGYLLVSGDVTGTFATVNGNAIVDNKVTLLFGGQEFEFTIDYSNGVALTIPEPSTFFTIGVGVIPILWAGRRRRLHV